MPVHHTSHINTSYFIGLRPVAVTWWPCEVLGCQAARRCVDVHPFEVLHINPPKYEVLLRLAMGRIVTFCSVPCELLKFEVLVYMFVKRPDPFPNEVAIAAKCVPPFTNVEPSAVCSANCNFLSVCGTKRQCVKYVPMPCAGHPCEECACDWARDNPPNCEVMVSEVLVCVCEV